MSRSNDRQVSAVVYPFEFEFDNETDAANYANYWRGQGFEATTLTRTAAPGALQSAASAVSDLVRRARGAQFDPQANYAEVTVTHVCQVTGVAGGVE